MGPEGWYVVLLAVGFGSFLGLYLALGLPVEIDYEGQQ
jgi:hypothetical protein